MWKKPHHNNNVTENVFHSVLLTEFIKVCFSSVLFHDRTHHPGFEEGGPFVHQAPLPSNVTLWEMHIATWTQETRGPDLLHREKGTHWTHSGHHGVDVFGVSTVVC